LIYKYLDNLMSLCKLYYNLVQWIFWVGPFIKAALAALYHQIVIRAIPFKSKWFKIGAKPVIRDIHTIKMFLFMLLNFLPILIFYIICQFKTCIPGHAVVLMEIVWLLSTVFFSILLMISSLHILEIVGIYLLECKYTE